MRFLINYHLCEILVGESFEDKFALGAAIGKSIA